MRRSAEDERWREGATDKILLGRKNRKSGSTILYLTLTPAQQGTKRKNIYIYNYIILNESSGAWQSIYAPTIYVDTEQEMY